MDGAHAGRFLENLQKEIKSLRIKAANKDKTVRNKGVDAKWNI